MNDDIPTLEEFVRGDRVFPRNLYVRHDEFVDLYVRRNSILVRMSDGNWMCEPVVQIVNIVAMEPGNGAFTRLVDHIVNDLNRAVYVENAHNPRFRDKLERLGFVFVNKDHGPNYLFNFEGRLRKL